MFLSNHWIEREIDRQFGDKTERIWNYFIGANQTLQVYKYMYLIKVCYYKTKYELCIH